MASVAAPNPSNLLLGKGAVYFDPFTTAGAKTGEIHLGNCEAFEITPSTETATKMNSMEAAAGVYKEVTKAQRYDVAITGSEFNKENLALVLLSATSTLTQTSGTVTAETITSSAKKGRWYACAKRSILSVTVKAGVAGSTAMTLTTDYTIDAVTGRIYVVPGGSIADGDIIKVDYTHAVISSYKVSAGTTPKLEVFLRFVGDPSAGPAYEVQAWRVRLSPDGALPFISDDFGTWTLKGVVQNDSANRASSPYFDAIEL